MKKASPIKVETIPTWAIDPDARDRHAIATAFELAGMAGRWVRLTADTQRAMFGFVMFGRREIKCTADGIKGSRSACFGTDFSSIDLDWDEIEHYLAKQTQPIW